MNARKRRTKKFLYFLLPIELAIASVTFIGMALWLDLTWWGIRIGCILSISAILVGSLIGWKIVRETYFSTNNEEKGLQD